MEALILLNTDAGVLWTILESVLKFEGVKTAYAVTGQFDAVVMIQFPGLDEMRKIIGRIQHVKGVLRTQTLMTIPPPPSETSTMVQTLPEEEKAGPNGYPDK